jgi:hypothetical protein
MLDKQLEYYKEINNNNNRNQTNMVKNQSNMVSFFAKLIEVMNIMYAHASNIQVPNPILENEHDELN